MGLRNPTNQFVADDHNNGKGNNRLDSTIEHDNSDNDALILWRVDPTGQFWRLDASAIGRGCSEVEREFLRHVKEWKRNTRGGSTQPEGSNDDLSEVEEEGTTLIQNIDVRAYLGSLSVSDAVLLATDCLVNGIMTRRSRMRRRRRKNSMIDRTSEDNGNRIYKRGLKKRVRVLIIRSNAKSNHHNFSRSRKPLIELVV